MNARNMKNIGEDDVVFHCNICVFINQSESFDVTRANRQTSSSVYNVM